MTAAYTKPVRTARFGGTAAAETANSVEPAAGVKDTGWLLDDEPPSSTWNWLRYRDYKWFRWLNERLFDGATVQDFTINAPAPDTTADDGGDLILKGGVAGTLADNNGGDATLSGGDGTGTGSSKAILMAATAGAAGVGARVPVSYFECDGANDVTKANRRLIMSHNVATRGIMEWTPQTGNDPGGVSTGEVRVRSIGNLPRIYNGTLWDRFQLQKFVQTTVPADLLAAGTFASTHTIPADALTIASVIKIRVGIRMILQAGAGAFDVGVRVATNVIAGMVVAGAGAGQVITFDIEMTMKTIGAAGTWVAVTDAQNDTAAPALIVPQINTDVDVAAINTTAGVVVDVTAAVLNAGDSWRLELFNVDWT
jgi:hypothetical protein